MARGSQIVRQWCILRLLEGASRGMRSIELHEQLMGEGRTISERTVYRDLQDLQAAGFPLRKDHDERWRLERGGGYSVPVQPTELLALLFSEELLAPLRSGEVVGALASLREKVGAMLTPVGRGWAEELKGQLIATFVGPGDYSDSPALRTIEEAIDRQHRVRLRYWGPRKGITERVVDPYLIWYADARLYLVGWCRLRDNERQFLVDRIRDIDILDEEFTPNPAFDARKFTRGGLGAWSSEPERVVLDFSQPVAHLPGERRFHFTQEASPNGDGSVRVTMHIGGLPHVAAWVASFGGQIVARAPAALVEMVRRVHRSGLAAHGGDDHS